MEFSFLVLDNNIMCFYRTVTKKFLANVIQEKKEQLNKFIYTKKSKLIGNFLTVDNANICS